MKPSAKKGRSGASVSPTRAKVKKTSFADYAPKLLVWYDRHRRILLWRALPGVPANPYRIWLSEIMLQQTTVATVGPYFQKFVARWPSLADLAAAPIDDIMAMWAGLGYYRRARMLYACAQYIVTHCHGRFPNTVTELLALPGFGPYTAAAVGAIAFDQPANVVDGNVERVMARIFAIETPLPAAKPAIRAAAAQLLPPARHGDYAQALMDLGATICTPRNPKCVLCPWHDLCQARQKGIAETLPRRQQAKAKPTRRAVAFLLTNKDGDILLRLRPPEGLLGGMLEVPTSPWTEMASAQTPLASLADVKKYAPTAVRWQPVPGLVKHVFSHFTFEVSVVTGVLTKTKSLPPGQWVALERLGNVALPSVMFKIVRHAYKNVK